MRKVDIRWIEQFTLFLSNDGIFNIFIKRSESHSLSFQSWMGFFLVCVCLAFEFYFDHQPHFSAPIPYSLFRCAAFVLFQYINVEHKILFTRSIQRPNWGQCEKINWLDIWPSEKKIRYTFHIRNCRCNPC